MIPDKYRLCYMMGEDKESQSDGESSRNWILYPPSNNVLIFSRLNDLLTCFNRFDPYITYFVSY
jgi:hypothetical protein